MGDLCHCTSRELWAYEVVDLSDVAYGFNATGDIRLLWTAEHKLDFVGIDTSPNAVLDIHELQLIHAVDSNGTFVKNRLQHTDERYAELYPGEYIDLTFQKSKFKNALYHYILKAVGHYETCNDSVHDSGLQTSLSKTLASTNSARQLCANVQVASQSVEPKTQKSSKRK